MSDTNPVKKARAAFSRKETVALACMQALVEAVQPKIRKDNPEHLATEAFNLAEAFLAEARARQGQQG